MSGKSRLTPKTVNAALSKSGWRLSLSDEGVAISTVYARFCGG
jgi:hypothetical protein